MRKFSGHLALAMTATALFGLAGCQESNETAAGGGTQYEKPANVPSPADYAKGAGKTATPPPPEDETSKPE